MAARAVVAPRVGVAILGLRHLGAVAAEEEEREGPDEEEEDDDLDNAEDNGLIFETKDDTEEKNEVYSENEVEVTEGSFAEKTVLQRSIIF